MAKQTFTTGQVLTAAQMTSLQQTAMGGGSTTAKTTSYVLTAADAGTVVAMNAAGATTITVNTGLFSAGDTVFIQNWGAGTCTVTAGTATVTTHGSLALGQWEGGTLYFTSASAAIFFDISQTSGMTNPMTTTGDTIYSSSGSTPARLGIGSTGQVLTVAGGIPSWATPASGGGMTLINTGGTTLSGSTVTISSIPTTYIDLRLIIENFRPGSDSAALFIQYNSDTGSNYRNGSYSDTWATGSASTWASTSNQISPDSDNGTSNALINVYMPGYSSSSTWKPNYCQSIVNDPSTPSSFRGLYFAVPYKASAAITSLTLLLSTGSFTSGTAYLYGVK